jgi:DNA-binding protein HU-beta
LTKADVIDAVAAGAELSRRQAGEIVDLILKEITTALRSGDRVALNPFGAFVVRSRQAREGRNPKTGETITIAARRVPAFVAGTSLKEAVGGVARKKKQHKKLVAHNSGL